MPRRLHLTAIAQTLGLALALLPLTWTQASPEDATPANRAQVVAQTADADGIAVTPTLLETKLKEVAAATELDEAAQAKQTEQYRKALSSLEAKKSYEAKAATYRQALESAPADTQHLRAQVDDAPMEVQPAPVSPSLKVEAIAQLLAKQQAEAALEETRLATIEKALAALPQRPAEVRARSVEIGRQLEQIDAELAAPTAEGDAPALTQARGWALQSARAALAAEDRMLNQELASLAVRSDLLAAQRDKSALDLKAMKARQQALETAANDRRRANAEAAREQAKEAEAAAQDKAPIIQQMARDNRALGEDIALLTARLDRVEAAAKTTEAEVKGMDEDFRGARERLEIVGSNRALGQVLTDKRKDLPDLRRYRKTIAEREEEIADTTLAEIRRRDERRALRDLDTYMDKALAAIPADQQAGLRDEVETLVRRRLALLDQLRTTAEANVRALHDINYATQQLISTAEAYSGYLSERLLWVRSVEPLDRSAIAAIPAAVAWLLSPSRWGEVLQTLAYQATHPVHALLFWTLTIATAVLALRGPALRRAILATAGPMRRVSTDSFGLTLKAIALSALVAAPVALALALIGWQLTSSLEVGPFAKQVGGALLSISVILYYLRSFRILCIPGGVADKHFRWPADALARLRRSFDWLAFIMLPVGFVALGFLDDKNSAQLRQIWAGASLA